MTPADIIVVDDEAGLRAMIEDYLTVQAFTVRAANGGQALDRLVAARTPDVILLDINMPGEDGLSILQRLRRSGARMGVIMLTANGDETAKVAGLGGGADDYIAKPFDLRELAARIRSLLRRMPARTPAAEPPVWEGLPLGAFRLDLTGRRLFDAHGLEVEVSSTEFDLLEVFARHPRQILSRERLCELAHGRPLGEGDRSVDIRMARLRKKLGADQPGNGVLRTVRGEGYAFDPP